MNEIEQMSVNDMTAINILTLKDRTYIKVNLKIKIFCEWNKILF